MAYTYKDLQDEVKRRAVREQGGTQFDVATRNIINTSLFRISRESPWRVLRRKFEFETEKQYTTGTGAVAVTNDSKSVTVTGATLFTDGIEIGRRVDLGGSNLPYVIETITSEEIFTVDRVYDGTTSTTESYKIYGRHEYNLPIQADRIGIMWHEDYGYPYALDYMPTSAFFNTGTIIHDEGTPTHYRMWDTDMVLQQPTAGSVLQIKSSDSGDTSIDVTVFGTVSGYPDREVIVTNNSNGTTAVNGLKSFTHVERIVKDASSVGRITATSNSTNVTVVTLPTGDSTAGIPYQKIQLYPIPDNIFKMRVWAYKQPWRLVNDNDVHELGQEFDEAIILMSVAKIKAENNQKESEFWMNMFIDELKSLKRHNADKFDFIPTLRRPGDQRDRSGRLHRFLGYHQLGGSFGPASRR